MLRSHSAVEFAIATSLKWVPVISMALFILSGGKYQRKFDVAIAKAIAQWE